MRRRAVCLAGVLSACSSNAAAPPALGPLRWAVDLGGTTDEAAIATAFDMEGDVVVLGAYADMPSDPFTPSLPANYFLTKLSAIDGSQIWRFEFAKPLPSGGVWPSAFTVDANDTLYLTGTYDGRPDFGGQVLGTDMASRGTFIATYGTDGSLLSVRGFAVPPTVSVFVNAIAIDGSGHAVIAGSFGNGSMQMGAQAFNQPDTEADGFVAAMDTSGSVVWGQQFATTSVAPPPNQSQPPGGANVAAMATAANGDLVLVGTFRSPTAFGGVEVDPDTFERAFMVRCDANGNVTDARAVGAGGLDHSTGIDVAITDDDRVVVHTLDALSGWYPSNHIYAFGPNGDEWTQPQWDDNNSDGFPIFRRIAATPGGRVVSAAWVDYLYRDQPDKVRGNLDIAAYTDDGDSTRQSFAARMSYGDRTRGGINQLTGTAADRSGNVVFLGTFNGTLDFGSGPISAHGDHDVDDFIALFEAP
jgi:hypothetical protein